MNLMKMSVVSVFVLLYFSISVKKTKDLLAFVFYTILAVFYCSFCKIKPRVPWVAIEQTLTEMNKNKRQVIQFSYAVFQRIHISARPRANSTLVQIFIRRRRSNGLKCFLQYFRLSVTLASGKLTKLFQLFGST